MLALNSAIVPKVSKSVNLHVLRITKKEGNEGQATVMSM